MILEEYIVQGFGSLALENARLRAENDALMKLVENCKEQIETLKAALSKVSDDL